MSECVCVVFFFFFFGEFAKRPQIACWMGFIHAWFWICCSFWPTSWMENFNSHKCKYIEAHRHPPTSIQHQKPMSNKCPKITPNSVCENPSDTWDKILLLYSWPNFYNYIKIWQYLGWYNIFKLLVSFPLFSTQKIKFSTWTSPIYKNGYFI